MELLFEGGGGSELDGMVQLLKQSLNLHVFLPEVPGATASCIKESMPSVPVSSVLVPGAAEPTVAESLELLDSLLGVVTNATAASRPPTVFEWWWTILKTSYLVLFYPDVWKRVGLLDLADAHGFPVCPPSIQGTLIKRFDSWKTNATITSMLWNQGNYAFAMEVMKQATELPLAHHETIFKALDIYQYHLLHHRNVSLISDSMAQPLWRDFASFSCNVIATDPLPRYAEAHSKLIVSTLASLEHMTLILQAKLDAETWRHMQFVLLEATMTFLRKNQSNMLSDNKNDIVRNAEDIIAMLFNVWIRSSITTKDMWNDFHKYFSAASDWPHAIRQWRSVVHKLTDILVKFVYTDQEVFIKVTADTKAKAMSGSLSTLPLLDTSRHASISLSKPPISARATVDSSATPRGSPASSRRVTPTTSRATLNPTSPSSQSASTENLPSIAPTGATGEPSDVITSSSSSSQLASSSAPATTNTTTTPISAATTSSPTEDAMSNDTLLDGTTEIKEQEIPSDAMVYSVPREQFVSQYFGVPNWTKERIQDMWKTILNIVGNVNAIKSSLNFELAMRCVGDVVSKLMEAESKIPLDKNYRRIPPIETFFPWVMEACFATGEKIRGVIIAFQILCQLFIAHHAVPLPNELLAHFYRAIQIGLKNDNPMVRDQILTEARHVFSYGLAGCHILIPDMLTEIASIFKTRSAIPEVQKHAMTLFNSLLCYVNHHKDIEIPDIAKVHAQQLPAEGATKDPVISTGELRETVSTLIASFLNNNMDPSAKSLILWGVCIMLLDEIRNENPRMGTTTTCLQAVLFLARHPHDGVAVNAANVLTALSDFFPSFNSLDKNLPYSIINLISDTLTHTFGNNGQPPPLRENVIVALFEALTSWLAAGPNDFLRDKSLAPRVFSAIELGLFGQALEPSKLSNPNAPPRISNDEDHLTAHAAYLLAQLRERPSHNSALIKGAAETALCTVLELMNNFPTPAGATQIDSSMVEIPELPVAFFSNNLEQIFSVQIVDHPAAEGDVQLSPTEATMVRVIVRDSMGKHCWDIALDYREYANLPKFGNFDDPIVSAVKPPAAEAVPKKTDLLATLLSKYDEKHLDCLPQTPKFSKFTLPPNPHESYVSDVEAIKRAIVETTDNDTKFFASYNESRPNVNDLQTAAPEPVSHMSLARIALSHLGFLTPQSRRNFHLVADTPELRTAIASLDQMAAREQHPIAVRFIAAGEETIAEESNTAAEKEPSKPSPLFEKFVAGLGWRVDLSKHKGFRGQLDEQSETSPIYYGTTSTEVLFEVVNELKAPETREKVATQNLVEIVWSEHHRDYAADFPYISGLSNKGASAVTRLDSARTMPASSTTTNATTPATPANTPKPSLDVSIGIYPLPNGQCRVSVQKRDLLANSVCGPLLHGMVVSPAILPTLVRLTSCFSRRRSLATRNPQLRAPRVQRLNTIRQLSADFRQPRSSELFLSCLYPLNEFPDVGVCDHIPAATPASGSKTAAPARGSASTAYVPGVVDAAAKADAEAREKAEAEAKAKADAEAKAKIEAAAAAAAAATNGLNEDGTGAANATAAVVPAGPTDAVGVASPLSSPSGRLVKQTSRAYGVSRSAGSGRSLAELTKIQAAQVAQQQAAAAQAQASAQAAAQAQAEAQAQQAQQSNIVSTTPRKSPRNGPVIEEVVLPAMAAAPAPATPLDLSPFDEPPPPPPSDSPAPIHNAPEPFVTMPASVTPTPPPPPPEDATPTPTANAPSAVVPVTAEPLGDASPFDSADPAPAPATTSTTASTAPVTESANNDASSKEVSPRSPRGTLPQTPQTAPAASSPKTTPRGPPSGPSSPRHAPQNSGSPLQQSSPTKPTQDPTVEKMGNRPPAVSNPVPMANPPPAGTVKNFGGPGKLPSGFKVPYGVGAYKVPAGVPKAAPPPSAASSTSTPPTQ